METGIQVLDCTLRDGGYYNHWDFDQALVKRYLDGMEASGIPLIELGFRNFPNNSFQGAYAYTTDTFLDSIALPKAARIGVMLDASAVFTSPFLPGVAVRRLFRPKAESHVSFVRLAVHFRDVERSEEIAATLKSLGYIVCVNLMQSGGRADEELLRKTAAIRAWNSVDVLYFADSLGNMTGDEVTRIAKALRSEWPGAVGIHTHDNKGLAIANTLAALAAGVTWVDSTALGMGRGAGNARTEILLMELAQLGVTGYRADRLYSLILDCFDPLKALYGWGPNMLYHLAAQESIHPTFVQELLSDKRYSSDEIVRALQYIAPMAESSTYSSDLLQKAMAGGRTAVPGTWTATDWCKDRDVLVMGAGPSLNKYAGAIESFIRTHKPVVLSLNIHDEISTDLIDGYVAVQPERMLIEAVKYKALERPLYAPRILLQRVMGNDLGGLEIRDFGLTVEPGIASIGATNCTIPHCLSIAYALCLVKTGGARRIFLVGVDGYGGDDPRQQEMIDAWKIIREYVLGETEPIALTPTTYPIARGSVYATYHAE